MASFRLVSTSWAIVSEVAHILLGLVTELSKKQIGKTLRRGNEANGKESVTSTGPMTGSSGPLSITESVTASASPVTDFKSFATDFLALWRFAQSERRPSLGFQSFLIDGPLPVSLGRVEHEGLASGDALPGSAGGVEREEPAPIAVDKDVATRSPCSPFIQCLGSSRDSQFLYMQGVDQTAGTGTFTLLAWRDRSIKTCAYLAPARG